MELKNLYQLTNFPSYAANEQPARQHASLEGTKCLVCDRRLLLRLQPQTTTTPES